MTLSLPVWHSVTQALSSLSTAIPTHPVTPQTRSMTPSNRVSRSSMCMTSLPVSVSRIRHRESVARQPGLKSSPKCPPEYLNRTHPDLFRTSNTLAWQSTTHIFVFLFSFTKMARSPGVKSALPFWSNCIT